MKGQLFSAKIKGFALSPGLIWYKWTGLESELLAGRVHQPQKVARSFFKLEKSSLEEI